MKLRIGDKVRFLNEVGEGVVSRIRDNHSVFVEMPDGFEIPFEEQELVPIDTEMIADRSTENIALDPEANIAESVYFVVEPGSANDFKLYLFNPSSYSLLYAYSIIDDGKTQTLKHGEIGAYQKVLLKQVRDGFFSEYPMQKMECLFFRKALFFAQPPLSRTIRFEPGIFRQPPVSHSEFSRPVYPFMLRDEFVREAEALATIDLERIKSVKEFSQQPKKSKSSREYLRSLEKVVDLHINELVDDPSNLRNFEMLNLQLDRFERELDSAISKGMKKITFIHGVGNGRLRQEIINILRKTEGISFHDAPFKEFGFGATQVNIH